MTIPAIGDYKPNLSIRYLFSQAWSAFKANVGMVFAMMITPYIVFVPVQIAMPRIMPHMTPVHGQPPAMGPFMVFFWAMFAVIFLVTIPLYAGMGFAYLRMVRGEEVGFLSIFDGFKKFPKVMGVFLLIAVAWMLGGMLLLIPGIILLVCLFPASYLVLDQDLGVMDTMRASWRITRGYRLRLFGACFVAWLFAFAGILAFFVGMFFTSMFSYLVFAAAVNELTKRFAPEPPFATPIV